MFFASTTIVGGRIRYDVRPLEHGRKPYAGIADGSIFKESHQHTYVEPYAGGWGIFSGKYAGKKKLLLAIDNEPDAEAIARQMIGANERWYYPGYEPPTKGETHGRDNGSHDDDEETPKELRKGTGRVGKTCRIGPETVSKMHDD